MQNSAGCELPAPFSLVIPTVRVGLPISINPISKLPHKNTQRIASWVIFDPVKLTVNFNHHIVHTLFFFFLTECQHLCALCLLLLLRFLVVGSIVSKCPPAVREKLLACNFAYLELDGDSNFDGRTNDAQFISSTIMKLSVHLGDRWTKEWNQQVPVFSLSSSSTLKCWGKGLKTCHGEHAIVQVPAGERSLLYLLCSLLPFHLSVLVALTQFLKLNYNRPLWKCPTFFVQLYYFHLK